MTDRPRKARASKRQLRVTAWMAGGLAFAAPFAAIAVSPKPDTGAGEAATRRPVRVVHVTRRVVIVHPRVAQPAATFVPTPSAPSRSTSAPAPADPPATSTGGS
jgi:hypothetical protein